MAANPSTRFTAHTRLLGGALAAMLLTLAASWWSARQVEHAVRNLDESHRILYELEATLAHAISIQSGARGFALTGDERYLAPYTSGVAGIKQSIARLRSLTAGDNRQQSRLHRLSGLVDEEISIMQQRLSRRRSGGLEAASAAATDGRGKQAVEAIRGAVAALQTEERRLLDARTVETQRAGKVSLGAITTLCAIAAIFVAIALRRPGPPLSAGG
ncbi:MAG: CHASE3 domain-containing protein [Opitutus sp.]